MDHVGLNHIGSFLVLSHPSEETNEVTQMRHDCASFETMPLDHIIMNQLFWNQDEESLVFSNEQSLISINLSGTSR